MLPPLPRALGGAADPRGTSGLYDRRTIASNAASLLLPGEADRVVVHGPARRNALSRGRSPRREILEEPDATHARGGLACHATLL